MSIGLRQELEDICMKADRREAMRREQGSRPVPARVDVGHLRSLIAAYPARNLAGNREQLVEVLRTTRVTVTDEWLPTEASAGETADRILAARGFRSEAAVKRSIAEAIVDAAKDHAIDGQVRLTELIHIANEAASPISTPATRPEATIKAEALREAATAARADAANSRTPQGHAEATTYADWLDDRATEIDPARLEGAHP